MQYEQLCAMTLLWTMLRHTRPQVLAISPFHDYLLALHIVAAKRKCVRQGPQLKMTRLCLRSDGLH